MNEKPFMREVPKPEGGGFWSRYPVLFASITDETEKKNRLKQIKNCKTRDDINRLAERSGKDFTNHGTKSYYDYPIPLDTLHRINLIFDIYRSIDNRMFKFKNPTYKFYDSEMNTILEIIRSGIDSRDNEIFYAFNSNLTDLCELTETRKQALLHPDIIRFYEYLRNDIIRDTFRNNKEAIRVRQCIKDMNKAIYAKEKQEGALSHKGLLPLWDYKMIDSYHHNCFIGIKERQRVKICDICGLMFYGASGGKHNYCGVHTKKEINHFKYKLRKLTLTNNNKHL